MGLWCTSAWALPSSSPIPASRTIDPAPIASRMLVAQATDDPLLKEAERLFLEGRALARKKQYKKALAKFLASYRIVPSRTTPRHKRIRSTLLFLIGRSYQLLNQYVKAGRYYRRFLETAPEGRFRDMTARWLKELWPYLRARLSLTGAERVRCSVREPRGVRTVQLPARLNVEAGQISLTCKAEGYRDRRLTFRMEPQSEKQQQIEMIPLPPPVPPTSSRDLRWIAYMVGGVGLAAVGAGGVFGGLALASHNAREDAVAQAKSTGQARFTRQALEAEQASQQNALTANVMFGVGGGVAIVGIILYFVLRPKTSQPGTGGSVWATARMKRRKHSDETSSLSLSPSFKIVVSP